jgi:hypothetical protein
METFKPGDASGLRLYGRPAEIIKETTIRDLWADAAARPYAEGHINHVYVHVPFCKSICHFCNYTRLRPGTPGLMRKWMDRTRRTLETLSSGLKGHVFHTLYLGGGTPNILPADILEELYTVIGEHVEFVGNNARLVECDPALLSARKLDVFKRFGVQHISFGVQSLDESVHVAHDRGDQQFTLIAEKARAVREAGFSLSMDFLAGLALTDAEGIFEDIDRALELFDLRWLDLFFVTPTDRYVDLHFGGSREAFWDHQRAFADIAKERMDALGKKHGYRASGNTTHSITLNLIQKNKFSILPRWDSTKYSYTPLIAAQNRPMHTLSLGNSARGRVFGRGYFEYADPGQDPEADGPAEYHGTLTDLAFECRTYLLYAIRDRGMIDRKVAADLFGMDVTELIPEAIEAWRERGILVLDKDKVGLTPMGRQEQIEAFLWMFPAHYLERKIAELRNINIRDEALCALLKPLSIGEEVGGGWIWKGVEGARIHLKMGDALAEIRFSPRLDALKGVEVIVSAGRGLPGVEEARETLQQTIEANGSNHLGPESVGTRAPRVFSAAGQHLPASRAEQAS